MNSSTQVVRPPSLLGRQRQALSLLDAIGGSASNTDFQKLLFLYTREPSVDGAYEFVPYRFGAFSFTLYADKRKLTEQGFLVPSDQQWTLTPSGTARLGESDLFSKAFALRMKGLRGDNLVAETYRQYPYYAIRSEIAGRVLKGDSQSLERIRLESIPLHYSKIATIGYEERTLENYLNLLIGSGVTLLCDVRRNPLSRKYGFSKATLAKACEGVGIRYEHLPDLGISSEQRRALDTQEDYDALFSEYEASQLPHLRPQLLRLGEWVAEGQRLALTCYERLPAQCHRHCVSDALEDIFGLTFRARHL